MAWERCSGGSCVIFVFLFLSCTNRTQINGSFTKPKYDRLLFTLLFVFASHVEHRSLENFSSPWRAFTVDLQSLKKNK
jgi:hypothetical protein